MTTTTRKLPPIKGLTKPNEIIKHVREQRRLWDADYPYRPCRFFSEEEIFKRFNNPKIEVIETQTEVVNPQHTVTETLSLVEFGGWMLMLKKHKDGELDWDFCVWNGFKSTFHPDEAANQILMHHSEEVFNRWRRVARAQFTEAAPKLIKATQQVIPTFSAGSITCSDSSERLMKSVPGIIVQNKVAYLIWS